MIGFLTIGIPTVYRTKGDSGFTYLKATLDSLTKKVTDDEKSDVVLLVFIAEFDLQRSAEIVRFIQATYASYLNSGFIQIMQVKKDAYPPLEGLKRNYNDDERRVKWRSKQVVDYAFMFYYARNISQYYIQIEDDVYAATGFIIICYKWLYQSSDETLGHTPVLFPGIHREANAI